MRSLLGPVVVLAMCIYAAEVRAEPHAQVRASLAPQDEIWVGQRVTLIVELLAPGTFASAPAFDLPRVSGVVIVPPSGSPVLGTETIDETSYTSQRHELTVISQRAGKIQIPPFSVRFSSAPTFGQPAVDQVMKTMPVEFAVRLPPGAEGLSLVITATDLKATQNWNPLPGAEPVKLGSAFTRTITVEADDVPAMVLPAFPAEAPPGLAAYSQPPVIEDHTNRGVVRGRRVDSVTYVCESPGTFTVPGLSFAWWDPQAKKLNRVELPGQTFQVPAPPSPATSDTSSTQSTSFNPWFVLAFGVAVGIVLAAIVWWSRRHRRPVDLEAASFETFQQACDKAEPAATLSALFAWLDRALTDGSALTLTELSSREHNPELVTEIAALEAIVYGRSESRERWSSARLLHEVTAVRHHLRRCLPSGGRNENPLPPLNPS